ncbi:MAG TPA: SPFH domain-containing protein [Propionibacteriaceae bacterium]|nr:SPFH domain-containing protein [Propionibacteriaceae bacterium]
MAKPNEAFIITGRTGKEVRNPETGLVSTDLSGQKVVMGGGVFVVPFIQRLHVLDLSSRRIMVTIRNAVSGQGIKLNVDGVAIVKVGGNEDSIRASAQRFLSQQDEIETFTQETLAGSLRSIVGSLTVEQIIRDRAAFAQRVTDESESSLTGQGLVLDTFQIQDITDDGTYLSDLGRPESAKLGRMAAVAEAEARREAEQAQIAAEQEIAIANRALVLKQAEIQAETDAARAQAEASGPLARADRDQAILFEQEKVAVAQAALTERQLDTEVRRPADAERYRVETAAEAQRNAAIFEAEARKAASIANAEAEAEKARLSGVGEKSRRSALAEAEAIEGARRGEAEKARRIAEAEAVRAEGEAQAAAVLAVGQAEAEAMDKRAAAFAHYNEAAVLQMLIDVLPQIAEKVAAPMGNIETLTVISTEGASALPKAVTTNMLQTLQLVKDATGYDLTAAIERLSSKEPTSD